MPVAFGQSRGSETGIHAYIERLTTALSAPMLTPRPGLVVDVDAYLAAKARRASQDDMLASYQRWGRLLHWGTGATHSALGITDLLPRTIVARALPVAMDAP